MAMPPSSPAGSRSAPGAALGGAPGSAQAFPGRCPGSSARSSEDLTAFGRRIASASRPRAASCPRLHAPCAPQPTARPAPQPQDLPRLVSAGSPPPSPALTPARHDFPASLPGPTSFQTLPAELLQKVFAYLSRASLHQCALVCQHWYLQLPGVDPRRIQARWQAQRSPFLTARETAFADGYHRRSAPWLSSLGCTQLAALERQSFDPQMTASFPGLLQYALQQQWLGTKEMALRPAGIDWDNMRVRSYCFSPCSRWLAAQCQPWGAKGTQGSVLRIYSWDGDNWQQDTLSPEVQHSRVWSAVASTVGSTPWHPKHPVNKFAFCTQPSGTLISMHHRNMLVWRHQPCTGKWLRSPLYKTPDTWVPSDLMPLKDGALVVRCRKVYRPAGDVLLFFEYKGSGSGWGRPEAHIYARPQPVACVWGSYGACPVLLAQVTARPEPGLYDNLVHVWRRHRPDGRSAGWKSFTASLPVYHAAVRWITGSTDGQQLLAWLSNSRLFLLSMDARGRLKPQCHIDCGLHPRTGNIPLFRSDGQQLVVPWTRDLIQILGRNAEGNWYDEDQLFIPLQPGDIYEDSLRKLMLSDHGRTLIRLGSWQVDILHKNAQGRWQRPVRRAIDYLDDPSPQGCFLSSDHLLCVTAAGQNGDIQLHGPDEQGQLVTRARYSVGKPVIGISVSTDGLSLLITCRDGEVLLLQVSHLTDSQAEDAPSPPAAQAAEEQEPQQDDAQQAP